ncbi:hypothetical protein BDR03DRAFT_1016923 [Suillus americanus]|nr:hypothetical protein BDR03DRAFT_1016923 [Suillus americanus]
MLSKHPAQADALALILSEASLSAHKEEEIESLSQLLKTVGQLFDTPKAHAYMDVYFACMECFRCVADVIKLRDHKWVGQNAVAAPTTFATVHEGTAAEKESFNHQIMTVYKVTPPATTTGSKVNADRGPPMAWPAPFGRDLTKEEAYIQKFDASPTVLLQQQILHTNLPTTASTLVPNRPHAHPSPDGKILIIGGGIANFTNVVATFKGIIGALTSYKTQLIAHKAKIYFCRSGPNWQEGLKAVHLLGVIYQ